MDSPDSTPSATLHGAEYFATTHWSLVLVAGRDTSSQASEALEKLCQTYWYPLYSYIRRKGLAHADAKDLTQEYFARLIAKSFLDCVDRGKGRFRSFLLASLNHFLANEWDKARTLKRGGGQRTISLDDEESDGQFLREPATEESPEKVFEQQWALALLDRALVRVREEFTVAGKARQFELLKGFLSELAAEGDYAALSGPIGLNPGAVAVAVHRLRQRYRELVRAEIAQTVASPADIEDEMRHLFAALG